MGCTSISRERMEVERGPWRRSVEVERKKKLSLLLSRSATAAPPLSRPLSFSPSPLLLFFSSSLTHRRSARGPRATWRASLPPLSEGKGLTFRNAESSEKEKKKTGDEAKEGEEEEVQSEVWRKEKKKRNKSSSPPPPPPLPPSTRPFLSIPLPPRAREREKTHQTDLKISLVVLLLGPF